MKRRKILLAAGLILTGGFTIIVLSRPREPIVAGMPLSELLASVDGGWGTEGHHRAVASAGREAVPWLIRTIKANEPGDMPADTFLGQWLQRNAERLYDYWHERWTERGDKWQEASRALGIVGSETLPEVRGVIERRLKLWGNVEDLKPAAFPYLLRTASDTSNPLRAAALADLDFSPRYRGQNVAEWYPAMIELQAAALTDTDGNIRRNMRTALGSFVHNRQARPEWAAAWSQLGPELRQKVVQGFIANLNAEEWLAREQSAKALGGCGEEATSAVPHLVGALGDESPAVRSAAAYALAQIKGDSDAALAPLRALQQDAQPGCRVAAAAALAAYGIHEASVIATLQTHVMRGNLRDATTIQALVSLGELATEPALPAIFQALDGDVGRRMGDEPLAELLRSLGKPATPHLVSALAKRNSRFRFAALEALDLDDEEAQPVFRQILTGNDDELVRALNRKLREAEKRPKQNGAEKETVPGTNRPASPPQ